MSIYQRTIRAIDPTVNPAGVEASMRLRYGVLDHLSREDFAQEIEIAKACEEAEPGYMRSVAVSYGMAADYDAAQAGHEYSLTRVLPNGSRERLDFMSGEQALERLRQAIRGQKARPPGPGPRSRYEIHHKGELMLEVWHETGLGWVDRGKWA